MSTEPQAEAPARRPRRGTKTAAVLLAAAATEGGWEPDIQLLFLGGFISRKNGMATDPSHFTDATVEYAKKMGWSLKVPLTMMCQQIDDDGDTAAFGAYLEQELANWKAEIAAELAAVAATVPVVKPKLESTPYHIQVYETPERLDHVKALLSQSEPIEGTEIGMAVMAWHYDFPGGFCAHIEVANGEPVYLDAFLTFNNTVVVGLPTCRELETTFEFAYDGREYRVTFNRA